MIEQLPCASCTALCCGPVGITEPRLKLIREHLHNMPHAERERLAGQKREELDCRFVDKANHRCTIYPVRPWICEIFGRTEGMVCPVVGHLVQIMPAFLVDQGFAREDISDYTPSTVNGLVATQTEKPAGMSNLWDWERMDFES